MSRGATSGKVHTVTSIALGLKNLQRGQDATVTFTHVDTSEIHFDNDLNVKLEDLNAEYVPGKVFAEGGQGIIREGIDVNLRRLVAIKTLKAQPDDQFTRGQFLQEARVTAQLSHPAIIPIYSLNTDEKNGLHLVMKLADGKTLKSYLEQLDHEYRTSGIQQFDERKSLMYRLEIMLRVCDALDYAHSRNIMHCDLKPENILIGEFRETYIMDWGIARQIEEPGYDPATWVRPSTISGTPRFLSPEAINGEHTDQRADIYALGLILFEVTTLKEAYMARTSAEVVSMIRENRIAETRHKYGAKIDPDLKAIIAKATAYDREKRYQTVHELSDDIRRFMGGEETSANPRGIFGKLTSFAVRHKRTTFAFAVFCILLLLTTIGGTCYRRIKSINAVRNYNRELGESLIRSNLCADYIESNIARNAQFLSAVTAEYIFLSETDMIEGETPECMVAVSTLRNASDNPPPSFKYSKIYSRRIDFSHFAHKTTHGDDLTDMEKRRLHILSHLKKSITAVFEDHLPPEIRNVSSDEKEEYLCNTGIPLHLLLFGFPDGQYVVYPGSGSYKPDYDPRKRTWYRNAVDNSDGGFVWTKPYPGNTAEAGYLLSCEVQMLDTSGGFLGVAGFDLSLKIIINELKTRGNTGNKVIEKTLLNNDGLFLLSTGSRFANAIDANKEDTLTLKFDDADLFRQFKELKYGTITREENGHRYLYCVNYLLSQDWYYFEKIDITDVSGPGIF